MDPRNGQIKAWVGSRDFSQDPFDHVQQARRQPGSTFKPFVYAAAFEARRETGRYLRRQARRNPARGRRNLASERRGRAERARHQSARRPRLFAQPDHRATDGAGRPEQGRATGPRDGRARQRTRSGAVARARHEPGHAEGNGLGVRHDRQPRRLRRTGDGHAHRKPQRRGAGRFRAGSPQQELPADRRPARSST